MFTATAIRALLNRSLRDPPMGRRSEVSGSSMAITTRSWAVLSGFLAMSTSCQSDEDRNRQLFVAVTGLRAFAPADEIEGMIAAQAMAAHHASMECSRRAMLHEQPFEAAQGLRKAAANASRTFVELLSALDRKRGTGGQQKVTVEHVHVHSGGQAVVGNIATAGRPGGGGAHEIPEEPHARALGPSLFLVVHTFVLLHFVMLGPDPRPPPVPTQ